MIMDDDNDEPQWNKIVGVVFVCLFAQISDIIISVKFKHQFCCCLSIFFDWYKIRLMFFFDTMINGMYFGRNNDDDDDDDQYWSIRSRLVWKKTIRIGYFYPSLSVLWISLLLLYILYHHHNFFFLKIFIFIYLF